MEEKANKKFKHSIFNFKDSILSGIINEEPQNLGDQKRDYIIKSKDN